MTGDDAVMLYAIDVIRAAAESEIMRIDSEASGAGSIPAARDARRAVLDTMSAAITALVAADAELARDFLRDAQGRGGAVN